MDNRALITLTLNVEEALAAPAARLADLLRFTLGEGGITVTAVKDDKNGVTLANGHAVIHYTAQHVFYRELCVLCEHARLADAFEVFEDTHFSVLSAMVDTSRNGVPTVEKIFEFIDVMATMGYSMMMLYTEDTLTLEGRPYFGYMRGRYTCDELRAIDDYAYAYGIEVIPCLECYAHMNRYLIWPEAKPIKDTKTVMLAREEATFEFVEQLITTAASCFRSRRIHIGMDEAWDMGRGKFLDKHGYVPPAQIFAEYMERLIAITRKHGLTPMMWSDMYWRVGGASYGGDPDNYMLPEEIVREIPEEVELIFWHYGEQPFADDYMLRAHKATGHKTIYAGGLWGWIGHFPEHHYAMQTTHFALDCCRRNDVHEAMITIWTNDNAECDLFANIFGLSHFAERCYDADPSDEKLKARFEACTGADYDAFLAMADYHNDFTDETRFEGKPAYHDRFLGKPLFWQDVMEGLYDTYLFARPMSGHYAAAAAKMKKVVEENADSRWLYLYELAYRVLDYLATKTLVAERLVPAYRAGDKQALAELATVLLPTLKEKTVAVHKAHRDAWMLGRNMIGWCNLDIRYAGVAARCDTAMLQLDRYLTGKDACITSLEEERLHKKLSGFAHYSDMSSPNEKT